MTEWHSETIAPAAARVLDALRETGVLEGAYLAGGTGLALHLGHRRSVDLDLFFTQPFDEDAILQRLQGMTDLTIVARATQTLHLTVEGVKVSFLGYAYPLLFPPSPFRSAPIADPRDIACMKITAIASRGTRRDFVDLYAACKLVSLPELLMLFDRKYAGTPYNRLHVLKSLTWFGDAEKDPMPHMLVPIEWSDVRRFFEREAPRLR